MMAEYLDKLELFWEQLVSIWEGFVGALLISLYLIPMFVGWVIIVAVGLRFTLRRLSASLSNQSSKMKGEVKLGLYLHGQIPVGRKAEAPQFKPNLKMFHWKVPDWILKNMYYHLHRLTRERREDKTQKSLSKDGGSGSKYGKHSRSSGSSKLFSVTGPPEGRFHSRGTEREMSLKRLDYFDYDLSRYGTTPQHFYKEKKPIIFRFMQAD